MITPTAPFHPSSRAALARKQGGLIFGLHTLMVSHGKHKHASFRRWKGLAKLFNILILVVMTFDENNDTGNKQLLKHIADGL